MITLLKSQGRNETNTIPMIISKKKSFFSHALLISDLGFLDFLETIDIEEWAIQLPQ